MVSEKTHDRMSKKIYVCVTLFAKQPNLRCWVYVMYYIVKMITMYRKKVLRAYGM